MYDLQQGEAAAAAAAAKAGGDGAGDSSAGEVKGAAAASTTGSSAAAGTTSSGGRGSQSSLQAPAQWQKLPQMPEPVSDVSAVLHRSPTDGADKVQSRPSLSLGVPVVPLRVSERAPSLPGLLNFRLMAVPSWLCSQYFVLLAQLLVFERTPRHGRVLALDLRCVRRHQLPTARPSASRSASSSCVLGFACCFHCLRVRFSLIAIRVCVQDAVVGDVERAGSAA